MALRPSGQLGLFDDPAPDRSADGAAPPGRSVRPLPDDAARRRIAEDLATSLFVEAGAGAGKTTMLSTRVVSLLCAGVPIAGIAAITFTEKAAAELRSRIRDDISAALRTGRRGFRGAEVELTSAEHAQLATALDSLDQAAIGTLHSFAQRILREFPIEARLPPAFTVHDEVASDLAFAERWTLYLDQLLADPARAQFVMFGNAAGISLDSLRSIAEIFSDNWDLVERRVDLTVLPPDRFECDDALRSLQRLVDTTTAPVGDRVGPYLDSVAHLLSRLRSADDFLRFQLLADAPPKPGHVGNKQNWARHPQGDRALEEFRREAAACRDLVSAARSRFREGWSLALGAELGALTLWSAQERRAEGALDFHDLLVFARDLLARVPRVRRILHDRYRAVLLDEFQDTDPIQLEIALRITASPDDDPDLHPDGVLGLRPLPGRLFIVGDPKQSIYRFRRADMAMYLRAQARLDAEPLALTSNFRSRAAVLDWVNAVFAELITPVEDGQPQFRPLDAVRDDPDIAGSVTTIGTSAHPDRLAADELRRREAAELAEVVLRIRTERWSVGGHGARPVRPARLGDIALLVPARTLLPFVEEAFLDAGIPFQAENSSLVYATTEVRDLLLTARAIADASDELALVSVLRSPLFGCSDVDLFTWHERGGRFRIAAGDRPERVDDDPVLDAIEWLAAVHERRHQLTPSEILHHIVTGRRMFETAVAGPAPRDVWRRLRFVLDQARAWSDAGGVGLRHYLDWARRIGGEGRYIAEGVLPETDLDAVRIMTIHASKGLEFPIVIVAGLTTLPRRSASHQVVWTTDSWSLRKGERHEAFKPLDEQLSHLERMRSLYVACTRAEDHLVVSLHRTQDLTATAENATSAELIAWAVATVGAHAAPPPPWGRPLAADVSGPLELPWAAADDWRNARAELLEDATVPASLSATAFATRLAEPDPALEKDAIDLEQPAWQRGRYGTAIGRAVHGVLQAVPLDRRLAEYTDLLEAAARSQAAAEGVDGDHRTVAALAESAVRSETVAALSNAGISDGPIEHWKETYVGTAIGGTVVEGYVDLLIRTPAGLVVVDYKTDVVDGDLDQKVVRYAPQLAVYGVALERVLAEPIVGARLLFCRIGAPAIEVEISDWPAQMASVTASLEATRR